MDAGFKEERPSHPRAKANIFEILTFGWTLKLFKTGRKRDLEVNDLYTTLNDHSSATLGNELEKKWRLELAKAKQTNRQPSLLRALLQMFGPKLMLYGFLLSIVEIVLRMIQPISIGYLIGHFDSPSTTDLYTAIVAAIALLLSTLLCTIGMHQYMLGQVEIGFKIRVAVTTIIYSKPFFLGRIIAQFEPDIPSDQSSHLGIVYGICLLGAVAFKTFGFTAYDMLTTHMGMKMRVSTMSQPLLIGGLLAYFDPDESRQSDLEHAYIYAFGLVLSMFATLILYHSTQLEIIHCGMKMRVACCSTIFYKALRLSKTALGETTVGQVVNLLSNDVNRFDIAVIFLHYLWIGPLETIVVTYFLWQEVGVSSIFGVGALLMFIPLQGWLGKKTSEFRMKTAIRTDERVRLMNEIISGIQVIKMYTWEKPFAYLVQYARKKEIQQIKGSSYIRGVLLSFIVFHTRIALFFSILSYVLLGNFITAQKNFLLYEEKNTQVANRSKADKASNGVRKPIIINDNDTSSLNDQNDPEQLGNLGIVVSNATAKWTDAQTENSLENINLTVKPGRLVAVIGPVGAGKSSLLHAILRELPLSEGNISVRGVVSYASQEPWLFAGSVQQNILFGLPMDKERYRKVIKVCALKTDFEQFPYGDRTIVGERGVSLSGGQRARINLARAIYKPADIYLLDDPLSAVDTHVGKHLFEICIKGYLKEKTCILITHQLQYLTKVDQIILMENANILAEGSYQELQASGLDFTKLLGSLVETTAVSDNESSSKYASTHTLSPRTILSRQVSIQSVASSVDESKLGTQEEPIEVAETRSSGNISLTVYSSYFSAGGNVCKISFLLFMVNLEELVFRNTSSVNDRILTPTDNNSTTTSTTSGRILNRFSKDMGAIDEMLPVALMDCIQIGLTLLGIIIVVGLVNVYLMIPTFIVGIVFYKIRVFYLSTSRSVKRLEGVTRSPVFAHLNASLQGLTTIRAFEAEQILSKEFDNHQDLHSSAWYLFISSSRAFGFWLDMVCLVYISVVTFSFLIMGSNTFGGNVGLAITQAIGLTGMFQWGMRQSAELENQMTSVERVLEYTNAPQESALESPPEKKPSKEWPQKGQIIFKNFYLRYSQDSPHVLKDLNIKIESMEKIGIVGRTGAGKSSLIGALFRLAVNEGSIFVDDLDINDLGLHELRSKLSIIPQEPVLFSGTMRKNLDPFDEYPDHALWNALDEVELKDAVEDLPGGLNSKMSEGGSNFSVGQRQLVCLARAIVRNNKVLVLDEATANVDPQTDALIQNTIRNKFKMCTVLTIAHRLNTVMDSDKVLVMDAGKMVEFDHPHNLLKNKDGFLYKMVDQTGKATAELLHSVAAESYRTQQLTRESPIKLIDEDVDDTNGNTYIPRSRMDAGHKEERPLNPRAKANIFEIFTYSWIFKLFKVGRKRDLEFNDLYIPLNNDRSSLLGIELKKRWKVEMVQAEKNSRKPSLLRVLVLMFGAKLMLYGLIQAFVEIVLRMSQPIFIAGLLEYFNPDKSNTKGLNHAYYYASGLLLNMLANILLFHYSQMEMGRLGMKIRVACCSVIYKKALRLSKTSLGETTIGQVVNLLSNDANRFDIAFIFIHFLWVGPLQTIVVTYFLWQELGVSSLIGVVIFLLFIPLQGWLGKKTSEYRSRTAPRTDERVRLMNEIISGIQVIKMYTWEKPFAVLVQLARKMELKQIRGVLFIRVFLQSFVIFHLRIALFTSILSYVLLGNYINTQKIFVILSYLKILTTMTVFFPQGILTLAEMLISIKRIQTFFLQDEKYIHNEILSSTPEEPSKTKNSVEMLNFNNHHFAMRNDNEENMNQSDNLGIDVLNASAKWILNQPDNCLNNINLSVRPGRLVAVIGPVGAGKSSLIQAILRELPLCEGSISVSGTISYASQEPWLFNGSIQQNILFGSPMDQNRYKEVVKVCALKTDFKQLPYGDRSLVGERGVSLSGGQRARVNLARQVEN
ncbi:hypothetical protein AGLY_004824 [Aphis glycines]|uniref:Multidrug resistance-associated protein lethal(2)03659 n=1 Tax=Aphis glycines TaxID=307491 RepID=A0A6G0TV19_APHGL|nr:hypothetical protein AGLY_004824 [Aphis glycines]